MFWRELTALCGGGWAGEQDGAAPRDDLTMHVHSCEPGAVTVDVSRGGERAHTWIVATTATGLRLRHVTTDDADGGSTAGAFGGDAVGRGDATRQEFRPDLITRSRFPDLADMVWTITLEPARTFSYTARDRAASEPEPELRFRFDLTRTVPSPDGNFTGPER